MFRGSNFLASGRRKPPDFREASGGLRPPLAKKLVALRRNDEYKGDFR